MTRKCIYIFFDLIFKVTIYHYRIYNLKVTNKNEYRENYTKLVGEVPIVKCVEGNSLETR